MFDWLKAQGPTFNVILITALTAIAGVVAFSVVGWLGVAMLGFAVVFLANRIDLNEDAVAGYARQVQEMTRRDPRERQAESAGRAKAGAVLKSVGIALFVLGFAILFLGG